MSDLNLRSGLPAWMRLNGLWRKVTQRAITTDELLAAILRRIIETGGRNVSTYEAPIEFDFDAVPNPGGPVSQSTIPEHLKSFLTATRNSTRTAPDVVLIGESRDPDTLRGMMESAEIGVAAYSTVHTRSVPETLSRIINVFPFAERLQVAATLLSSLRLVISQRLLPLPDNNGRIALREYLAFTPEIREMLLEIPAGVIEEGESGEAAVLRELEEETGKRAGRAEFLCEMYPSVGFCTEKIQLFFATELTAGTQKLDADEFVEIEKYTLEEAIAMIHKGEIKDGKTIAALFAWQARKNA